MPSADQRALRLTAIAATLAAAAYLRLSNLHAAVVGDEIAAGGPDAAYHARRMLLAFEHYPRVPAFDPLLGWPGGSVAPWPPAFDFLVATAALLASDRFGALVIISLAPVLLGLLLVALVYGAARKLEPDAHWSCAWLAATLVALFPQAVSVARFGNPDHHGAEALIMLGLGIWSVFGCRALADGELTARKRLAFEGWGALLVAWAVPTFIGTAAYIAIACASMGIANGLWGRGAAVRWAVGAPALALGAALATPIYGPLAAAHGQTFSYVYPSLLQPLLALVAAVGCVAASALGWASAERRRLRAAAAILAASIAVAALLPSARAAAAELLHGLYEWFFDTSSPLAQLSENQPLFSAESRKSIFSRAHRYYGVIGPLLPLLVPLGLALHVRRMGLRRAFPFVIWTAGITLLMLQQNRFGRVGLVNLALCTALCAVGLAQRWPRIRPALAALPLLLLVFDPAFHYCLAPLPRGPLPGMQEAGVFLRAHTPRPSKGRRSGVLVPWDEAHFVVRYGERPVTATGFGIYVDPEAVAEVADIWPDREARLLRFAEQRDLGFVALSASTFTTMRVRGQGPLLPSPDGSARWNWNYVKRVPLSVLMFAGSGVADLGIAHASRLMPRFASTAAPSAALQFLPETWIYEIVAGARVRGQAAPRARIRLHTDMRLRGRTIVHEAWTEADAGGAFELITPLPTDYAGANFATRAEAVLTIGEGPAAPIRVPERAVRGGETIPVVAYAKR